MPQPVVYCHDVYSSYPPEELRGLPGVPGYAARVLASTYRQDIAILPGVTKPHFDWIAGHYEAVGLPFAQEVRFGGHKMIRRYLDHELSVFYFGAAEHSVRPNLRWLDTAATLNSKNHFIALARRLGVRTPKTVCVDRADLPPQSLLGFNGKSVYVKRDVSASGLGIWRVDSDRKLYRRMKLMNTPYQVQQALPIGTKFLNVQYETGHDGSLVRGPITYQILRGNTHSGNHYPTPYNNDAIYTTTDPLAKWAVDNGIQGVFAFDVAVTPDLAFLPIECNPRWNGSTYYSRVAHKLGVDEWQSINVDFKPRSFKGFELPSDLAFCRQRGQGVIIVNWGCVGDGKLGLFIAGSAAARGEVLREFQTRFS